MTILHLFHFTSETWLIHILHFHTDRYRQSYDEVEHFLKKPGLFLRHQTFFDDLLHLVVVWSTYLFTYISCVCEIYMKSSIYIFYTHTYRVCVEHIWNVLCVYFTHTHMYNRTHRTHKYLHVYRVKYIWNHPYIYSTHTRYMCIVCMWNVYDVCISHTHDTITHICTIAHTIQSHTYVQSCVYFTHTRYNHTHMYNRTHRTHKYLHVYRVKYIRNHPYIYSTHRVCVKYVWNVPCVYFTHTRYNHTHMYNRTHTIHHYLYLYHMREIYMKSSIYIFHTHTYRVCVKCIWYAMYVYFTHTRYNHTHMYNHTQAIHIYLHMYRVCVIYKYGQVVLRIRVILYVVHICLQMYRVCVKYIRNTFCINMIHKWICELDMYASYIWNTLYIRHACIVYEVYIKYTLYTPCMYRIAWHIYEKHYIYKHDCILSCEIYIWTHFLYKYICIISLEIRIKYTFIRHVEERISEIRMRNVWNTLYLRHACVVSLTIWYTSICVYVFTWLCACACMDVYV